MSPDQQIKEQTNLLYLTISTARFVLSQQRKENWTSLALNFSCGSLTFFSGSRVQTNSSSKQINLLLGRLVDERRVDVRNNSSISDGSFDEGVKFFIPPDGKLQMSWGYTLYLQILACITCQLQHFCSRIL